MKRIGALTRGQTAESFSRTGGAGALQVGDPTGALVTFHAVWSRGIEGNAHRRSV